MAGSRSPVLLSPGFRLFSFDAIDSTNAEALRRLDAGVARHFDTIVATTQTAGRGRRGRRWHSPPGNLYLTIILTSPPARPAGQIAFVAALAVGDAIATFLPGAAGLRYKWPNDMLIQGRKVVGILIESCTRGEGEGYAVGIGVNVATAPEGTGTEATALLNEGARLEATDLVEPVCAGFDRWYRLWQEEGFVALRTAWLARAHGLGKQLTVHFPDGRECRGLFREIDQSGALVIEPVDGGTRKISAGDVFFSAA